MARRSRPSSTATLNPDAIVVSIAAGVRMGDLGIAFGGRPVARVMPITAVAIAKGVASIVSNDPRAGEPGEGPVRPGGHPWSCRRKT